MTQTTLEHLKKENDRLNPENDKLRFQLSEAKLEIQRLKKELPEEEETEPEPFSVVRIVEHSWFHYLTFILTILSLCLSGFLFLKR